MTISEQQRDAFKEFEKTSWSKQAEHYDVLCSDVSAFLRQSRRTSESGTSLTNRERLLVSQGLTTVVYDVRPINRDDRLASSLASMQPSRQPWCHRPAGIDRRRLVR
jgi:hypothetical protein